MEEEIINCLEKAFDDIVNSSAHFERNIVICVGISSRKLSINMASVIFDLTPNTVRQVFNRACTIVYLRFKYSKKGYHLPFYKPTRVGEVDYNIFKTVAGEDIFNKLKDMCDEYMRNGCNRQKRGWR